MAAMKELHSEFGEVVYHSEIDRVIPREVLVAKIHELADRYGNDILPFLNDTYDEICDYPEEWEAYSATPYQRAHYEATYGKVSA